MLLGYNLSVEVTRGAASLEGYGMATQYLDRPGGRIAYDDAGLGSLVLCVPGMGDLRQEYRFVAPRLVEAGYRVVTMGVRGHGESSVVWPDYSVGAIGEDILALVRHLDSGPAVLVGNSMVAGAAVWAAAEAPELVSGLVLVGPFVRDVEVGLAGKLLEKVSPVLFADPWGAASWVRYYTSLFPTRKPADFAEYRQALRTGLAQPGRPRALRAMIAASKAASAERLDRVAAPTLVVMGTKDPDFADPEAEARLVADRLHGKLELIAGAGHYPYAEMPEATLPPVLAFLREVAPAAKGNAA